LQYKMQISENNPPKEYCSWHEVESLTKIVADKIHRSNRTYDAILGITNGGIIPARLMARELNIDYIQVIPVRHKKLYKEEMPLLFNETKYLIIDEIYDTGDTFCKVYDAVKIFDCNFAFLMSRYEHNNREMYVGKVLNHNKWIVFPWE
jgi:hypoxanthine phosphoribosyltransferase